MLSRISVETKEYHDGRCSSGDLFTSIQLNLKPIGPAFRQSHKMARKLSVQRAATLGPRTNLHQVIIKNTHVPKNKSAQDSDLPVMRSQSFLSTNNVPILAPRRSERIRLEEVISDIWSKDTLPFPGMAPKRSENPIRASANSMMRKLSMASIASNFSRRSSSRVSMNGPTVEVPPRMSSMRPKMANSSMFAYGADRKRSRVPVDFQTAPDAFLPEDFELPARPVLKRQQELSSAGAQSGPVRPYSPLGFRRIKTPTNAGLRATSNSDSSVKKENQAVVPLANGRETPINSLSRPQSQQKIAREASAKNVLEKQVKAPIEATTTPLRRPFKSRSRFFKLLGLAEED